MESPSSISDPSLEKADSRSRSRAADLLELTKPEIAFLVAISAMAGFVLGSNSDINFIDLLHTMVGVAASASAGGILNHFVERRHDATMHRTATRPLASGRFPSQVALITALILGLGGVIYLGVFLNLITAVLAAATLVLYIAIYTPLKRLTHLNTIIGTIPGALPALGGWTAATGTLGWGGWIVFGILVCWQMPHFLSLAWMYRKDYARGGFKMLPSIELEGHATARQTLGFTILLVLLSVLPGVLELSGTIYLVGISIPGFLFLIASATFFEDRTHKNAKYVLTVSIYYIPILVVLLFADRLIRI